MPSLACGSEFQNAVWQTKGHLGARRICLGPEVSVGILAKGLRSLFGRIRANTPRQIYAYCLLKNGRQWHGLRIAREASRRKTKAAPISFRAPFARFTNQEFMLRLPLGEWRTRSTIRRGERYRHSRSAIKLLLRHMPYSIPHILSSVLAPG